MKLTYQNGRLHKIHIYVDGEYRLTVDDAFWFSERWHNLKEVNDEELAALTETVGSRRAFQSALDLLSRRDHSKKELLQKLSVKYTKAQAEEAVEQAQAAGLLDETRFAENYAQELYTRKGFGLRRIQMELTRKGIPREIAENALETLDKDDENRIIVLLREKYRDALTGDEKAKRRAVNALLRRGYSYSDIRSAVSACAADYEEFYDA